MSLVILEDVSLDYVRTDLISLKKTVLRRLQKMLGMQPSIPEIKKTHRALNNINLHLEKGDRLGILGRNGAGKSTLLRTVAKIYRPNIGRVNIDGKISTLFDIKLGLDHEADGYDNIVTLGILRGMRKKVAVGMINEIEEFTQLGDFLSAPVRTYSAGMQVKLSFAVATSQQPDILLIDEVIGAADKQFMEKAFDRLNQLVDKSHIMALASHSNDIIKRFCNKAIVLDQGEIVFQGDVEDSVKFYEDNFS